MPQNEDGKSLGAEARRWAQGYGVVRHDETTRKRAVELAGGRL